MPNDAMTDAPGSTPPSVRNAIAKLKALQPDADELKRQRNPSQLARTKDGEGRIRRHGRRT